MKLDIKTLLGKGVAEVIIKEHLESELWAGKKLRVKFGADPTSTDLHLGHAVELRKLRQFQDADHQVVFIIGDYTARIGDPSGKSKTRPALSREEIDKNAETYFAQAGKILDIKKLEIHHNSEWFEQESDWAVRLARLFTAQRILERDDFTKRLKDGVEIYLHVLLCPGMQGDEYVKISGDVEEGDNDQKYNMIDGRDHQKDMGLKEQDNVTVPQ